jgi:hypothetical protein
MSILLLSTGDYFMANDVTNITDLENQIKDLIVTEFNAQHNYSFSPDYFNIKYIPGKNDSDCAFELDTERTDDYLNITVYAKFGFNQGFDQFVFWHRANHGLNLNDMCFIVNLTLSQDMNPSLYKKVSNPVFKQTVLATIQDKLLLEDGGRILAEDGSYLLN